jgi:RNA polymerase sigma-70 factor (ECF subfamily)
VAGDMTRRLSPAAVTSAVPGLSGAGADAWKAEPTMPQDDDGRVGPAGSARERRLDGPAAPHGVGSEGAALAAVPDVTDELLVRRFRDGDPDAGNRLVSRHYVSLMRYLQRLAGTHAAEELHQQTWHSVLDHLDRFDPSTAGGGFKAWLFRIATNKANDHWRSRGREKVAKEGLKRITDEAHAQAGQRIEDAEQAEKLRRSIELLPEAQRQVLVLRYYSNLKFVEIAEILGCPLNTALGRVHKALIKLRQQMAE